MPLISGAPGIPAAPTPGLSLPSTIPPSTSSSSTALVVSNSLPPLPAKAMEKIQQGQFLDFKDLLPDNLALLSQLQAMGNSAPQSRLREIRDPLSWVFYFMYFLAASTSDPIARQLSAYGQLVIHLSQKHGGQGWLAYDRLFRQQKAAGSSLQWNELNTPLMASTVWAQSDVTYSCSLCAGSDHSQTSCALAVLSHPSYSAPHSRQPAFTPSKPDSRFEPYRKPICRRFNRGNCTLVSCNFRHICSVCLQKHPAIECQLRKPKEAPRPLH